MTTTTLPEWRIRGTHAGIGYVEIGPYLRAVSVGMTHKDQTTGRFRAWLTYKRPGNLAVNLGEDFTSRKAAGVAIVTAAAPELAEVEDRTAQIAAAKKAIAAAEGEVIAAARVVARKLGAGELFDNVAALEKAHDALDALIEGEGA